MFRNVDSCVFGLKSAMANERMYPGRLKVYNCPECNRICRDTHILTRHMRTHTGEKPFSCDVCEKRFSDSTTLKNHMSTHTGVKPHRCEVCGASFSRPVHLRSHMLIHTGEKSYQCEVCDKCFRCSKNLRAHMRVHTGERRFQCDICDGRFTESGSLKTHMRIHTGEKPYQCEVCQKRYKSREGMLYHKRLHTGEKPYLCEVCGKGHPDRGSLRKHKLRNHSEDSSDNAEKADDVQIETEIETKELKFTPVEVYVENNLTHLFLPEDIENLKEENDDVIEESESLQHENEMDNKTEVAHRLLSNIIDELNPTQKQICYICLNHKSDFGIEFPELIAQLEKSFIFENSDYLTRTVVQMAQSFDENSSLNLLIPNEKMEIGPDFGDDYSRFEHLFIKLNPLACSILEKIKPEMEVDSDDVMPVKNASKYEN